MDAKMKRDDEPARFLWLMPGLRPPAPMTRAHERIFLLVGIAALFAGYDTNIYGLATPQIQASLHIPEDQVGLTVGYFRLAAIVALALAYCADLVGRRRLLLITITGQALGTLATAFAATYGEFVWLQIATRVFGYAEEMLCVVVIVEEVEAGVRGWANGTLAAMGSTGTGIASLVFAAVNFLPFGWRAIYVIGALPLLLVAYLRRRLPETHRFEVRKGEVRAFSSQVATGIDLLRRLLTEYPGRVLGIVIAVAGFGFALGSATVLQSKYLQQTLGYSPGQVTLLFVPGGFVALFMNVLAGRISDRIGRRPVVITTVLVAASAYAIFFSGIGGWATPASWIVAIFGYFTTDALLSGYALELVPTAYRATMSGVRYVTMMLSGALCLVFEGRLYDILHAHGPAISVSLGTVVLTVVAVLFLPEPAGKPLEEIAGGHVSEPAGALAQHGQ
jgi:putative MFS transporter